MFDLQLNSQQQAAAEYAGDNHILVLAGAGTGKTRTIIGRVAYLLETGVKPWRILLMTFTRRAAGEMIERLGGLVGEASRSISAGTFHHFSLYTMRRMPNEFNIGKAAVIDRDDQVQLVRLIRDGYKKEKGTVPRAAEVVNLYSYARNTVQPLDVYLEKHSDHDDATIKIICDMAREYDRRKQANHYLDYDDILFRFADVIQENTEVRDRLKSAYDHILVDEMQDTNPLQWRILEMLKDPPRLFCVGDDAQSIYAFRGADFRNVHSFTERVSNSEIMRLEENFRSIQGVLDFSNHLLECSSIRYGKKLRAYRKEPGKPQFLTFYSDMSEARYIADDLKKRHNNGAPWSDHMILTRTGYAARTLESFMVERKIPYRFIGGASLLQAAHVKDLICLLRSAMNHRDELAWTRYLKLFPKIGDVTAAKMIAAMKYCESSADALATLAKTYPARKELIGVVNSVAGELESPKAAIKTASDCLTPILKNRYDNWKRRGKDFKLLKRMAEGHRDMAGFIESYTLEPISTSMAERESGEDAVTLITVHSAKGTEARVCYLIRVEPGMYPHSRSVGSADDEEEERRILYVAMTRAMDVLILTRTMSGWNMDDSTYFFNELDDSLVDVRQSPFPA